MQQGRHPAGRHKHQRALRNPGAASKNEGGKLPAKSKTWEQYPTGRQRGGKQYDTGLCFILLTPSVFIAYVFISASCPRLELLRGAWSWHESVFSTCQRHRRSAHGVISLQLSDTAISACPRTCRTFSCRRHARCKSGPGGDRLWRVQTWRRVLRATSCEA